MSERDRDVIRWIEELERRRPVALAPGRLELEPWQRNLIERLAGGPLEALMDRIPPRRKF